MHVQRLIFGDEVRGFQREEFGAVRYGGEVVKVEFKGWQSPHSFPCPSPSGAGNLLVPPELNSGRNRTGGAMSPYQRGAWVFSPDFFTFIVEILIGLHTLHRA